MINMIKRDNKTNKMMKSKVCESGFIKDVFNLFDIVVRAFVSSGPFSISIMLMFPQSIIDCFVFFPAFALFTSFDFLCSIAIQWQTKANTTNTNIENIQNPRAVDPSLAFGELSITPLNTVTNTNRVVIKRAILALISSGGTRKLTQEIKTNNPEDR